MLKGFWLASVATVALAGGALAGEKIEFAPPGDWVRTEDVALAPARSAAAQSYAVLNRSVQARLGGAAGDIYYGRTVVRIQSPLGLKAGQPAFSWNPDTETVTVHKFHILRGGQVIDVLARGQDFAILRRESRLENSMLDGELTAVMQTEGLQVGDVVDFAISIRRQSTVTQGRSYMLWGGLGSAPIAEARYRVLWPSSEQIQWRTTKDLPPLNVAYTAEGTELTVNLDGYKTPEVPDKAPKRYGHFGELQITEFKSWKDVSAVMAQPYRKASTFHDNSPLKAEVARIASLSSDPKVRAIEALKLVQEKVRYAYKAANEGGNIPMDADLTWMRRFGECKAKTVLLIGLLRELGVAAEPVLVNTQDGDGVNEHLPMLGLFDHVMVRAFIDGKAYWMDGTGMGDDSVDRLTVPSYRWVLPVRAEGADLEFLVQPPLDLPESDTDLFLDATAGQDKPAPARARLIQRGDTATSARLTWQHMLPEDIDERLRGFWQKQYPWIHAAVVTHSYDPVSGEMRYTMEGMADMGWSAGRFGQGPRYETDGYTVGGRITVAREDGKHDDIPVVVQHPTYERSTQTILLPDNGRGYFVVGQPVDKTLVGLEMKRSFALKDGVFTMDASTRSVASEVTMPDLRAGADELKAIHASQVYIEAPLKALEAFQQPAAGEDGRVRETDVAVVGKGDEVEPKSRASQKPVADKTPGSDLDEVVKLFQPRDPLY